MVVETPSDKEACDALDALGPSPPSMTGRMEHGTRLEAIAGHERRQSLMK